MLMAQQVGKGAVGVNVDDVSTVGVAAEGATSVADEFLLLLMNPLYHHLHHLLNHHHHHKINLPLPKGIIELIDADEDITLKDVAIVAKDVQVAEIKESSNDDEVEPAKLQEVVEVVTTAKLITEVVTAASATITVAAP
nr:hypothetical protein [Tanacetum cinerariifolium]